MLVTVGQLIELLEEYDPDLEVLIFGYFHKVDKVIPGRGSDLILTGKCLGKSKKIKNEYK